MMEPPANAQYYTYKHIHSVLLLVIAGPHYDCIYEDVGTDRGISDGGMGNKSTIAQKIEHKTLNLPPAL